MGRPCSICRHPQRDQIEQAIAQHASYRAIAAQYGLSKDAVTRHKAETATDTQDTKQTVMKSGESGYLDITKPHVRSGPISPGKRQQVQDAFLAIFSQNANMSEACETVGISRQTVYSWRDRDPVFAAQLAEANEIANDRIRSEIRRRGIEGWDEPLASAGKLLGTTHRYSDNLLMFLTKARMPEFRDRYSVDARLQVNHNIVPTEATMQKLTRWVADRYGEDFDNMQPSTVEALTRELLEPPHRPLQDSTDDE